MTLGSNLTLKSSTTETTWSCSRRIRKLISGFQQNGYRSRKRSMNKRPKTNRFRTCLMFPLKDREKMDPSVDSWVESTDSRLRELTHKWFTETQAPLIQHNGNLPAWFLGFITRKDAEETLRNRELGCFLIRLSDKAIGYILSYKGRDRCRHFVINQNKSGHFNVSGDTEMHNTLIDLIEYYQRCPIEPFGEYLTSSCLESTGELYDTIQVKARHKPVVSVKAVRNIWDQRCDRPVEQLPSLPPKTTRTLEEVPPLPKRGSPLKATSLDDQTSVQAGVLYAQLDQQIAKGRAMAKSFRKDGLHRDPTGQSEELVPRHQTQPKTHMTTEHPQPGTIYTEIKQLDYRSKSLPLLDNNSEHNNPSYRLSVPSCTSPRQSLPPPNQTTRDTVFLKQGEVSRRPSSSQSLDQLCPNPVYQLAGRPSRQANLLQSGPMTSSGADDCMYAEVPPEPIPSRHLLENTYEHIPEQGLKGEAVRRESNTYETLEDLKPKQTLSSFGLKNEKWRWLFPDIKRK